MSIIISVIVPVYNVEKYLSRCIESIINQTLPHIEIILVNDGSLDSSPSICDRYANIYENIKVIHKDNEGLGNARNSGLKIAKGTFVSFIDSDDTIHPEMYQTMYNYVTKYNLDTVYCGITRIPDNKTLVPFFEVSETKFFSDRNIKEQFIPEIIGSSPEYHSDVKYQMSACRAIYSRSIIKDNSIAFLSERNILSEDVLFNIDYLLIANKIAIIPDSFYYYWRNEGSLSTTYSREKVDRANVLYKEIKERFIRYDLFPFVINNVDRMFLCLTRIFITSEVIYNHNKSKRIKNIHYILNQNQLKEILQRYPFQKLPLKHRLFFICLKFKLVTICELMLKMTNHKK